jgi:hypothetical protein
LSIGIIYSAVNFHCLLTFLVTLESISFHFIEGWK